MSRRRLVDQRDPPPMDPLLPRLEQDVTAAVWRPHWDFSAAEFQAEYERRLGELHERLHNDARASFRAMDGWDRVRTQKTGSTRSRRLARA
jgi:hypothetical protein